MTKKKNRGFIGKFYQIFKDLKNTNTTKVLPEKIREKATSQVTLWGLCYPDNKTKWRHFKYRTLHQCVRLIIFKISFTNIIAMEKVVKNFSKWNPVYIKSLILKCNSKDYKTTRREYKRKSLWVLVWQKLPR